MKRHNRQHHAEQIVGRNLLLSLVTILSVLSAQEGFAQTPSGHIPKVVVNIMVEQLRSDYLHAFEPLYGKDGWKRLLNEGRVYSQAEFPMTNPDRASATAVVATGTTPSRHGITGVQRLDRNSLRPVFCLTDENVSGIGTKERLSPAFLAVSTIGDELKVATEGQSLVYAIAPTPDAAILAAGHAADAAVWIDDASGQWCTTSYYNSLPSWVRYRNSEAISANLEHYVWKPSNDLSGNFSYFLSGGMKKPFAHKFTGPKRVQAYKQSGAVNDEVAKLAVQCIEGSTIGQDAYTDYLSLTLYAGGMGNTSVSSSAMEVQDAYVRIDNALSQILQALEQKIGLQNVLISLTSTGTTAEETEDLGKYRIPTGTFDVKRSAALIDLYLAAIYGPGKYVEASFGTQLYLNHKLCEQKQIKQADILERVQDFLLQLSGVKDVYTSIRLLQGAWTPGISSIRNGFHTQYSGDVTIEIMPGWRYVNEDTKENVLVRQSYIPFPIIFFGYGLEHCVTETPVTVDYIAPTIAHAIHIRAPNACDLKPLSLK